MWNRRYFLDSYKFSSAISASGCLRIVYEHELGYDYLKEECSADILLILAKFADEIAEDLKKENSFTFQEVDGRIDEFLDFIKDYTIDLRNSCRRGSRTIVGQRQEIMAGRSIYRHYYSSIGCFSSNSYNNPDFRLTIRREEFKRIIYQFLLDEELDFQGFCIYLNYSRLHTAKLIYNVNSAVNPYIKSLIDKDIPVKHISSLDNFTLAVTREKLEEVMKDITSVL